jgi:alpha-L-fucosidase
VLAPVEQPVELFAPQPRQPIELGPLLRDASPGDIVQLGDGTYLGPITVPAGVIVRGLGAGRTTIDGGGTTAVVLQRNARLEHLRAAGGPAGPAWSPSPVVDVQGPYATVLGCRVDGHVVVDADDVVVRATTASGIVARRADRLTVSRCQFSGTGWGVGVELVGGSGHEVDSCEFRDHLCAIRSRETTGTIVRGNNVSARWWGIHLEQTEGAHVYGNFVDHTMRGIDIDGGTQAVIDGNAICDGDSGCIVEWGASDCQVSGNRWERCRIGILSWEVTALHAHDNEAIDLHEPDHAYATGP